MLLTLPSRLRSIWTENSSAFPESLRLNLNRILYCALVSIPINLVNIFAVFLRNPLNETEALWRQGVILGNGGMLLSMIVFLIAALRLRRSGRRQRSAFILSILLVLTLFVVACALCAVDQLITTNITPFVLACLVAGALLMFRPLTSGLVFVVGLTMFVLVIDRGGDTGVLLSNRINGLTAAGLGFLGLGAQPPAPEWGAMIATGRQYVLEQWWVATMPGIAIFVVSLGFNLLGDGLRDVLDPKAS